jgi:hypothetical protein
VELLANEISVPRTGPDRIINDLIKISLAIWAYLLQYRKFREALFRLACNTRYLTGMVPW